MNRFLLLRLDAPLMAFGGTMVDNYGVIEDYPGASLLTGLIANALGWHHRDVEQLQSLQSRLLYAVREDRRGHRLTDYQTVDLGQPHLSGMGWTTRGEVEERGGAFSEGTHIRYRDYLANACYTVAVGLTPAEGSPALDQVATALRRPARPLFIGRKPCLPAAPLLWRSPDGEVLILDAPDAHAAILSAPLVPNTQPPYRIWYPVDVEDSQGHTLPLRDLRDWRNQIHVGARLIRMDLYAGPPHV